MRYAQQYGKHWTGSAPKTGEPSRMNDIVITQHQRLQSLLDYFLKNIYLQSNSNIIELNLPQAVILNWTFFSATSPYSWLFNMANLDAPINYVRFTVDYALIEDEVNVFKVWTWKAEAGFGESEEGELFEVMTVDAVWREDVTGTKPLFLVRQTVQTPLQFDAKVFVSAKSNAV